MKEIASRICLVGLACLLCPKRSYRSVQKAKKLAKDVRNEWNGLTEEYRDGRELHCNRFFVISLFFWSKDGKESEAVIVVPNRNGILEFSENGKPGLSEENFVEFPFEVAFRVGESGEIK